MNTFFSDTWAGLSGQQVINFFPIRRWALLNSRDSDQLTGKRVWWWLPLMIIKKSFEQYFALGPIARTGKAGSLLSRVFTLPAKSASRTLPRTDRNTSTLTTTVFRAEMQKQNLKKNSNTNSITQRQKSRRKERENSCELSVFRPSLYVHVIIIFLAAHPKRLHANRN